MKSMSALRYNRSRLYLIIYDVTKLHLVWWTYLIETN